MEYKPKLSLHSLLQSATKKIHVRESEQKIDMVQYLYHMRTKA
jgi:hypothetical protein